MHTRIVILGTSSYPLIFDLVPKGFVFVIFYYIFVFFNRYLHICGFPPFAFYPTFYLWARLMTMVICACVGGNDKVLGDEMIEGKI